MFRSKIAAQVEEMPGPAPLPISTPALVTSLLRTIVPSIVALASAGLLKVGIKIDDAFLENLVSGVCGVVVMALYYLGLRVLEHFRSSKWGILLGFPSAPVYPGGPAPALTEAAATVDAKIEEQVTESKVAEGQPPVDNIPEG